MNYLYFKKRVTHLLLFTVLCLSSVSVSVSAQLNERVYQSDLTIEPEKKGELAIEIDNITFFKNNEYDGDILKGYTLPGFWFQGKAVYYPLENIKLEAGVHTLYYYGTKRYPAYAYQDIAMWNPDSYQHGVHLLPLFRAHISLSKAFDLVLGSLYGGANHQLIDPLYNPEFNLTADPEMGVQLLYKSGFIDADIWANWQSFIFKMDTHQEAFTFGLSSKLKYNDPKSTFHVYSPIQVLAQHRGGEIDTITTNSVQTLMNAAVGIGLEWNTGGRVFKKLTAELNGLGYYQQAGQLWPVDDGTAIHAAVRADFADFRVKTGYWTGKDFISLFGIPYYGAASLVEKEKVYTHPSTLYLGAEYSYTFAKGYALGVDLDIYRTKAKELNSKTSFSFGVYLRVNPSFLLKKY